MIYDQLSHLSHYLGLGKNLDTAIHYLLNHDLCRLPLGKTVIDGDNVFLNCMEAQTQSAQNKQYEMHEQYLDIQIDLSGTERVLIGDSQTMKKGEYDVQNDVVFGQCIPLADCLLGPGNFIICMAGEPHMPGVSSTTQPEQLKKCVVKVHQ